MMNHVVQSGKETDSWGPCLSELEYLDSNKQRIRLVSISCIFIDFKDWFVQLHLVSAVFAPLAIGNVRPPLISP